MIDREKVIKDLEFCVNGHFKVELSLAKKILAVLKEQEKPNGKCVNECECWDSAYERGKQDALKERAEEIERLKKPTVGGNKIPLKW